MAGPITASSVELNGHEECVSRPVDQQGDELAGPLSQFGSSAASVTVCPLTAITISPLRIPALAAGPTAFSTKSPRFTWVTRCSSGVSGRTARPSRP